MPSLISTDYPKSDEFHVGSEEHSPPCSRGRESAHLIFLFCGCCVCVSLSVTRLVHTRCLSTLTLLTRARLPSDCSYPASVPAYPQQRASHLHFTAAPRWVQPHFVICSFCVWTSPWPDRRQPWAVIYFKVVPSWVTWHIHFFILGSQFGASGGFGFLSDQSRGSHLICGSSVAEQVPRWTDSRLNHSSPKSIQPFCVWH